MYTLFSRFIYLTYATLLQIRSKILQIQQQKEDPAHSLERHDVQVVQSPAGLSDRLSQPQESPHLWPPPEGEGPYQLDKGR